MAGAPAMLRVTSGSRLHVQAIYSWWLYEMCDVFIELSKPVLSGEGADAELVQTTRDTLWVCLDTGLRWDCTPLPLRCLLGKTIFFRIETSFETGEWYHACNVV